MQFQLAKAFILEKLTEQLPLSLTYHNYYHTLDVYQAAENLGNLEKIKTADLYLLLIAALFHDAGFINVTTCHEAESCRIANLYLPDFEFSAAEIEKVCGMIMATKLPQSPQNVLEEIIADADLDYLGRDDFFPISDTLYTEFYNSGIVSNQNDWNKLQVRFFENHHYFTKSALKLRGKLKQENLIRIKSKINAD